MIALRTLLAIAVLGATAASAGPVAVSPVTARRSDAGHKPPTAGPPRSPRRGPGRRAVGPIRPRPEANKPVERRLAGARPRWVRITRPERAALRDLLRGVNEEPGEQLSESLIDQLDIGEILFGRSADHTWYKQDKLNRLTVDPVEIRARQEVFRDLLVGPAILPPGARDRPGQPRPTLLRALDRWLGGVNPWYSSEDRLKWSGDTELERVDPDRGRSPTRELVNLARVIGGSATHGQVAAIDAILRAPEGELSRRNQAGRAHLIKDARHLLDLMVGLDEVLAEARAPRLRQLRWLAQSVLRPDHPESILELHRRLASPGEAGVALADALADPVVRARLATLTQVLAPVEFYASLADRAERLGWTHFPTLVTAAETGGWPLLSIRNGFNVRNLVFDPKGAVANSFERGRRLGRRTGARGMIITGANNDGKTTYLRMVAQMVRLAQLGLPVPAEHMVWTPMLLRAQLAVADGPKDGAGLLMAEARPLGQFRKDALAHPFSLLLVDEMLDGTVDYNRAALEQVYLEHYGRTRSLAAVATHNIGTASAVGGRPAVGDRPGSAWRNRHVDTRKVRAGVESSRTKMVLGALRVIRDAGWSEAMVEDARALLLDDRPAPVLRRGLAQPRP